MTLNFSKAKILIFTAIFLWIWAKKQRDDFYIKICLLGSKIHWFDYFWAFGSKTHWFDYFWAFGSKILGFHSISLWLKFLIFENRLILSKNFHLLREKKRGFLGMRVSSCEKCSLTGFGAVDRCIWLKKPEKCIPNHQISIYNIWFYRHFFNVHMKIFHVKNSLWKLFPPKFQNLLICL